jgi:multidrug transporter EmrE-like cation transporter
LPVFEIGFFSTLFAALVLLFLKPRDERWRDAIRVHRPGLVALRGVAGATAGILGIYAFTTIPLAEAYALIFLAPLLVTVLSAILLKEPVGRMRWLAVAVGFLGVLLVVRPGFRLVEPGHFAALARGAPASSQGPPGRLARPPGVASRGRPDLGGECICFVLRDEDEVVGKAVHSPLEREQHAREAIQRHRDGLDADPVEYLEANQSPRRRDVRRAAASYMGSSADLVALTESTTMGIGLVYNGVAVRPGQELLTTAHDYFATHEALRLVQKRTGCTVRPRRRERVRPGCPA